MIGFRALGDDVAQRLGCTNEHLGTGATVKRHRLVASQDQYEIAAYKEQVDYQHELDRIFPFGGMCGVLYEDRGRLRPTNVEVLTGRLLCAEARIGAGDVWWHLLLLDPRKTVEAETDPWKVWIVAAHDSNHS